MSRSLLPVLLAAAALLGAATPIIVTAADVAGIVVDAPYARAVPPGQPNSAVFMSLTNSGAAERALVAAESDAADAVELHTHTMADGVMQMRRIERIDLPAGATVELAPGGLHVMLIGLKQPLAPGDEVALTLIYDDGSRAAVSAPVKAIAAPAMDHH